MIRLTFDWTHISLIVVNVDFISGDLVYIYRLGTVLKSQAAAYIGGRFGIEFAKSWRK